MEDGDGRGRPRPPPDQHETRVVTRVHGEVDPVRQTARPAAASYPAEGGRRSADLKLDSPPRTCGSPPRAVPRPADQVKEAGPYQRSTSPHSNRQGIARYRH